MKREEDFLSFFWRGEGDFSFGFLSWDGENEEREEEKIKSAERKNNFCRYIVFLQNPVFGELWYYEFGEKVPKTEDYMPKTPFKMPTIIFLANLKNF